jgi:hypothetical protein
MSRKTFLAAALALAALCGCSAANQRIPLRVKGNVPDASVTIDDMYLGSLSYVQKGRVQIPPGKHRVTVERAGYFPWDKLIEVGTEPISLDVVLVPVPD